MVSKKVWTLVISLSLVSASSAGAQVIGGVMNVTQLRGCGAGRHCTSV
jgi:hypothetical protein